jgi:signal transduction histidine kinase
VDVNAILTESLEELSAPLEEKRVQLTASLSPHLPRLFGDRRLLERAFDNIMKHAVISVPPDERLLVSSALENDRVVVRVRHKVTGFSEDDFDHFFLPRLAEKQGVKVLELPLCKIIVHRHGGSVDAHPAGDGDLELEINLPLSPPDSELRGDVMDRER